MQELSRFLNPLSRLLKPANPTRFSEYAQIVTCGSPNSIIGNFGNLPQRTHDRINGLSRYGIVYIPDSPAVSKFVEECITIDPQHPLDMFNKKQLHQRLFVTTYNRLWYMDTKFKERGVNVPLFITYEGEQVPFEEQIIQNTYKQFTKDNSNPFTMT